MNFSAKKLLNSSASKLCWYRNFGHREGQEHTPNEVYEAQLMGSEFQQRMAHALFNGDYQEEMGGGVEVPETGDRIYFSNDIVLNNGSAVVECKAPLFGNSEDFFNKSIIQCGFYSFLSDQCTILRKSKFACPDGNGPIIRLRDNFKYLLLFGNSLYEIRTPGYETLWTYMSCKLQASLDFKTAKTFDTSHPQKLQHLELANTVNAIRIA